MDTPNKYRGLKKWKKGECGNPRGRPKSNLNKLLAQHLAKKIPGDKERRTYERALVEALVEEALRTKDRDFFEFIWDRLEGKPAQSLDHTSGGQPISLAQFYSSSAKPG